MKNRPVARAFLLLPLFALASLHAGEKSLVDTTRSPNAKFYMPDLGDVHWQGGLLGERFEVAKTTMVPHMGELMSNPATSPAWRNYRIAAGLEKGKFSGPPFNDGDFLKWFEALVQIYAITKDPAIDRQMDEIIAVVAKAQREDGYLHTQTIIPQRNGDPIKEFADREHFETYNMGHLITAACIHYRVTGKPSMLDLARKAADYIDRLCKDRPLELARNAICPSHYMGVIELYRVTREPRYLALGQQLIEIRSLVPEKDGSDHNQDRMPFRKMTEAVGHAVRANYLYAGVADVFAEDGDKSLFKTLTTLSDNVAEKKLYITGMTGAIYDGASPDGVPHTQHKYIKPIHQAYGRDYQLPNLTAYNETCATIGYGMWIWRMLAVTGDANYADLFEQTLYNGILPGISLDGKDYFYVNALKKSADFKWPMRWSRTREANIPVSFCCPPNVVRTIAEAHNYVYSLSKDTVWVNLYAASTLDTKWTTGEHIKLRQETEYPWAGAIKFTLEAAPADEVTLKLRIPGWLHENSASLRVNGEAVKTKLIAGTYAEVTRKWQAGDVVTLDLAFKPVLVEANPLVEETVNQVAVKYGPLVYCLESNDLPKGVNLKDVALSLQQNAGAITSSREIIVNANVLTLTLPALVLQRPQWDAKQLYREVSAAAPKPISVKFVPYYAWGNRGEADMSVWIPAR
ncbi:glycoside hydrolase family 127 protein [Oleiharenicola lentus]|uniref:glycoside hydrolase family 127 protein n=1 Tax=Oleiharenicola lentus TaxID=2508720 RepID=UPI003F66CE36